MLPRVYENFIDQQDADTVIKFIDDNSSVFNYGINNLIMYLRYGKDIHFKEDDFSLLSDEVKKILNKYATKIVESSKEHFGVEDCYMTQAWLVKRLPGNMHGLHNDYEYGDEHIQFGGVIYLNDTGINGGGEIFFPKLKYEHKPSARDMILFNSRDNINTHGVKMVKSDRYSIAFWTTPDKNFKVF